MSIKNYVSLTSSEPIIACITADSLYECLEGILYVVLADPVYRPVIHEESDEGINVDGVHVLAGLREIAELHLVLHVVHFLLRRVVAHGTHQVRQLVQGHRPIETTRLRRVLVFAADHRVVEEVLHVLVGLTITPALDEVDKRLNTLTAKSDSLVDGRDVD